MKGKEHCAHKKEDKCSHPEVGGGIVTEKHNWHCSPVCGYHKPKDKK